MNADLLFHVVDISHPRAVLLEQSVKEVLRELGAKSKAFVTVLNKMDLLDERDPSFRAKRQEWRDGIFVSALKKKNFSDLHKAIERHLAYLRQSFDFKIPLQASNLIHQIYEKGQVLERHDQDSFVHVKANLPRSVGQAIEAKLRKLKK